MKQVDNFLMHAVHHLARARKIMQKQIKQQHCMACHTARRYSQIQTVFDHRLAPGDCPMQQPQALTPRAPGTRRQGEASHSAAI